MTLTVLEGEVIVETEILEEQNIKKLKKKRKPKIKSSRIEKGGTTGIPVGRFHRIITVSDTPSCYMYSYINQTKQTQDEANKQTEPIKTTDAFKRLFNFIKRKIENWVRAIGLVSNAFLNILYSVPMVKRVRVA